MLTDTEILLDAANKAANVFSGPEDMDIEEATSYIKQSFLATKRQIEDRLRTRSNYTAIIRTLEAAGEREKAHTLASLCQDHLSLLEENLK